MIKYSKFEINMIKIIYILLGNLSISKPNTTCPLYK